MTPAVGTAATGADVIYRYRYTEGPAATLGTVRGWAAHLQTLLDSSTSTLI